MIPELPVLPQLKRNFKLLRASTFFMNASSLMRHAAATEGKLAHLLPLDKREMCIRDSIRTGERYNGGYDYRF